MDQLDTMRTDRLIDDLARAVKEAAEYRQIIDRLRDCYSEKSGWNVTRMIEIMREVTG